jgi:L-ascorbate metabolism protein UlaG (beta-lactamase superfamily)
MLWRQKAFYVDPVGGGEAFRALPKPDLILITHGHGDHLSARTIAAVAKSDTIIVAPPAVAQTLKKEGVGAKVLANGETTELLGVPIEAVPMYNLTPQRRKYHPKGEGNGYVLEMGGKRIYIAGDTEDIPEMRKLTNIDVAFLCVNLPYTMDVNSAAGAVLEFKPRIVYPYHYRGVGGMSDLQLFEKLVGKESGIDVRLRNWYP